MKSVNESPSSDLGAITPEDLEIARQAARASKAFVKIFEVAGRFAEIVTRLDMRTRELAVLAQDHDRLQASVEALTTDVRRLGRDHDAATSALAQLRERSAQAERDAATGLLQLQREQTVAMDEAKRVHQNALRQLNEAHTARVKGLDEEYRGKTRRAAEALGLIEAKLTAAEAEARQTAERLVGP